MNAYKNIADFLTITIAEAHPTDGWHIKNSYANVEQHKNMIDREHCTLKYIEMSKTKATVVMDLTKDELEKLNKNSSDGNIVCAEAAYSAFPDRLYVIMDGVIVYKGGVGPSGYRPKSQNVNDNSLETFLKTVKNKSK